MKTCPICKITKSFLDFGKDAGKKDGFTSRCKECKRKQERGYYRDPLTKRKENYLKRKTRVVEENQLKLYQYLEKHSCVDCGEKDIVLLDFDHLRDKKENISKMLLGGYSYEAIMEEIKKCDVVCVKCHRYRTAIRANWKIYKYSRLKNNKSGL